MSVKNRNRAQHWRTIASVACLVLALAALAACAPGASAPAAAPTEPPSPVAAAPTQALAVPPATSAPASPTEAPTAPAATSAPQATEAPATATTAPTAVITATAPVTATSGLRLAQYQGVSFAYPPSLADGIQGQTVAAEPGGNEGPWWVPVPEHVEVGLTGYVLTPTFHAPRIIVYPVGKFTTVNEQAANRIASLHQLLQTQPADPGKELPFLPLFNAAQQMHAGVKYLPFQGGKGVRYLTQYAQAPLPINNHDLFYTYQGLTDDGKYYVAALLPVSHDGLPASYQSVSQAEMEALAGRFPQYIQEITQTLNTQPDASFKPSLADLDALVQSIAVKQ